MMQTPADLRDPSGQSVLCVPVKGQKKVARREDTVRVNPLAHPLIVGGRTPPRCVPQKGLFLRFRLLSGTRSCADLYQYSRELESPDPEP